MPRAKIYITTPYPTLDEVAAAVGLSAKDRAEVEALVEATRPRRLQRAAEAPASKPPTFHSRTRQPSQLRPSRRAHLHLADFGADVFGDSAPDRHGNPRIQMAAGQTQGTDCQLRLLLSRSLLCWS